MIRPKFGLPRSSFKNSFIHFHLSSVFTSPLAWTPEPSRHCEMPFKETTERLLQMTQVFRKKNTFQRTSEALHLIYSNDCFNVFRDLLLSPQREYCLTPVLCRGFKQSKSMKGFYLNQLKQCINSSDYRAFVMGMKLLEKWSVLNIYERVSLLEVDSTINDSRGNISHANISEKMDQDLKGSCLELLVSLCVTVGEPLLAASYALYAKDLAIQLKQESLERIISALSVHDPLNHNYNAFSILKLMETYKCVFSSNILLGVTSNLASGRSLYFANILFDKFRHYEEIFKTSPRCFERAVYNLILANMKFGNHHRAGRLCKLLYSFDCTFKETIYPILQALLENNSDLEIDEDMLLHGVSASSHSHPEFVDFALTYFGKRQKFRSRFESLTKLLKPPLKRSVLSLLFSAFTVQDREEAAEKILHAIFKSNSGINSEDFSVIINKLIAKNQIKQCFQMCLQNDFHVASKGSMKVLEYILAHGIYAKSEQPEATSHEEYKRLEKLFMKDLIANLRKKNNDISVYHSFTTTIFRHFSANISNRATRKLYSNLSYHINKPECNFTSLSSYDFPLAFEKFLMIDDENRVQCIEIILVQAKQQGDITLMKWCARELQIAGMPIEDIQKYYL